MKGILYLVSVPIGNLEDITLRAIKTLKEVNAIVCEDTREAGKLLQLLDLPKKQLISYREQNHERSLGYIAQILENGEDLALISDRGTPGISDPGFKLVRDLTARGIIVVPVPGPSAVIAALSASGLPTDRFIFLGFLPKSTGKQKKLLQQFAVLPATFIIYESPFRVFRLLKTILEELGEIDVAVARELTKQNEEFIRGKTSAVLNELEGKKIKGEIVVLGRASS